MTLYVAPGALSPTFTEVTATANDTTTSGTDSLLDSMTITPAAGTYEVDFVSSMTSNQAGAAISYSLYVGGTQKAATANKISPFDGGALSALTARGATSLHTIVAVSGAQAIEVRWSMSGGTATCGPRLMTVVRLR